MKLRKVWTSLYPPAVLTMEVGAFIYILIHLFFYVGGLPSSYYAYQVFLDSLMFVLFLSLPVHWFTGSRGNPFWLILCLVPELFLAFAGFSGYFPYFIPFFAQFPLLNSAIRKYYACPAKERVTVEEASRSKRRAEISLYSLVPISLAYILLLSFVFVRSQWVSTYTTGPNYTSHYTGYVTYLYPNLATFLGVSIIFVFVTWISGTLYLRYNKRAMSLNLMRNNENTFSR